MSIKADALSDEIAKLLSEYEAEIVKNTDACGKAVGKRRREKAATDQPQKNRQICKKLGRDKRERRVW